MKFSILISYFSVTTFCSCSETTIDDLLSSRKKAESLEFTSPRHSQVAFQFEGRLGNQILDLFFLSQYCLLLELSCHIPHWDGETFFVPNSIFRPLKNDPHNQKEKTVGFQSEKALEEIKHLMASPNFKMKFKHSPYLASLTEKNQILKGHFFFPGSVYNFPYPQKIFRELFEIRPEIKKIIQREFESLKEPDEILITVHFRGGDLFTVQKYWSEFFFVTPTQWFLDQINELILNHTNQKLVIYLATDSKSYVTKKIAPHYINKKNIRVLSINDFSDETKQKLLFKNLNAPEKFLDFYMLTRADFLVVSTSTFSYSAALINTQQHVSKITEEPRFFRSDPNEEIFKSFLPWIDSPIVRNFRKKIFVETNY